MRIRRFRAKDAGIVAGIIRKNLYEINAKDYTEAQVKNIYRGCTPSMLIKRSGIIRIYVAAEGTRILGTASLKGNVIKGVFIRLSCHGKGIGTRLISYLEKMAKGNGYSEAELASSITAYGFYKKLGYRRVRVKKSREFGSVIIMRKKI